MLKLVLQVRFLPFPPCPMPRLPPNLGDLIAHPKPQGQGWTELGEVLRPAPSLGLETRTVNYPRCFQHAEEVGGHSTVPVSARCCNHHQLSGVSSCVPMKGKKKSDSSMEPLQLAVTLAMGKQRLRGAREPPSGSLHPLPASPSPQVEQQECWIALRFPFRLCIFS